MYFTVTRIPERVFFKILTARKKHIALSVNMHKNFPKICMKF